MIDQFGIQYNDLRKYKYKLVTEYRHPIDRSQLEWAGASPGTFVQIQGDELVLRKGYAWDGPSGPTWDTPSFMRGSLVHDGFYQLLREGVLHIKTRDYSDRLLVKICREDGMCRFRAWYVYWGVRLFGGLSFDAAQRSPTHKMPLPFKEEAASLSRSETLPDGTTFKTPPPGPAHKSLRAWEALSIDERFTKLDNSPIHTPREAPTQEDVDPLEELESDE